MGKIKIKEANKGKFTAWANAHGMTVQQAAARILHNREKYSSTLIKRANFARNAAKWDEGGMFNAVEEYKSGGIHINPANKGKFNATKKRTGKTTEELTHSSNPKTRKRAIFAQNARKWHHGDGGVMEYGVGGAISAAGSLASLIPGVGTAVGAGINVIGGLIGANEQAKAQEAAALEQYEDAGRASAAAAQANTFNPYQPTFKFGGRFKGKRFTGDPNAEVEGGEVLITPDGISSNMVGPKHAQGGIDVNLPNKTMIFSDRIKVGGGQTAADVVRPFTKKINKASEILADGGTGIARNTAKRNLNKYYQRAIDAFNQQENQKFAGGDLFDNGKYVQPYKWTGNNAPFSPYVWPFPEGTETNPYSIGDTSTSKGYAYNFFGHPTTTKTSATTTKPTINRVAPLAKADISDMDSTLASTAIKPASIEPTLASAPATATAADAQIKLNKLGLNKGTDWGNVASTIGELAPTLYNLLGARAEKINESRYKNWNAGKINSLMANRTYDIHPELTANQEAFSTTAANMRNLGGSRGQVASNLTAAENTKQFADMSAWAQKHNMENQYAGEYANMLYGLGRDDMTGRLQADEAAAMNRASARNMFGAGLTGIQQYLLTRRQMRNQAAQSQLLGDALKAYSPYTAKWVPSLDSYISNLNKQWQ